MDFVELIAHRVPYATGSLCHDSGSLYGIVHCELSSFRGGFQDFWQILHKVANTVRGRVDRLRDAFNDPQHAPDWRRQGTTVFRGIRKLVAASAIAPVVAVTASSTPLIIGLATLAAPSAIVVTAFFTR